MYIYIYIITLFLHIKNIVHKKTSHFDIFINVFFFYIPVQVCMSVFDIYMYIYIYFTFLFFDCQGRLL